MTFVCNVVYIENVLMYNGMKVLLDMECYECWLIKVEKGWYATNVAINKNLVDHMRHLPDRLLVKRKVSVKILKA